MDCPPIKYEVLRDRRHWEVDSLNLLEREVDGALTLLRIPGLQPGDATSIGGPYDPPASGVAAGACGEIYCSDASAHQIVWRDDRSKARLEIGGATARPGEFDAPSGLFLGPRGVLYVADTDHARVQRRRVPTMEPLDSLEGAFKKPTGLSADGAHRVYVLDEGAKRILRFDAHGTVDAAYNAAMEGQHLGSPSFITIDADGVLYLSDDESRTVKRFDEHARPLKPLPPASATARPRALAAYRRRIYIADAESGRIWIYHGVAGTYLGTIPDFRAPVSAMAVDADGNLHVKTGSDDVVHTLSAHGACVSTGMLSAGPLDAGDESDWERVLVEAEIPNGTDVALQMFASSRADAVPAEKDWTSALALDTLVPPRKPHAPVGSNRYLWLRVVLSSRGQVKSPELLQVHAETARDSYLGHLPAIYRRGDEDGDGFLARWLGLFRSALGDLESLLDAMPRRFDPLTTPEDHLAWLSSWLAFALPKGLDAKRARARLASVPELYRHRGTPRGLAAFVEVYTGVRPLVTEAFHHRHIWQLGASSSRLGFDTGLVPAPDGLIVPGDTPADPAFLGLRGEYFRGTEFETLLLTRVDREVDFTWESQSPDTSTFPPVPADDFSVRWTGQIHPRYSETYTFQTVSDDGVRLWVDGKLIVDNWTDHPSSEDSGRIALRADKWHAIRLEYYGHKGGATIQLLWSSASQRREVVPQSRLYSVMDDGARIADASDDASAEPLLLVGQAIVGESGPQASSEFGASLFSETAHLFTVVVPPRQRLTAVQKTTIANVIEAEKPAHADCHVCFVEPKMRVGFQARVGLDTVVAGLPDPMTLPGAVLGLDSYLGESVSRTEGDDDGSGR